MKCPKCGTEARDVARFCQRCHATLRYVCPSCQHEQRQGGKCEKCGVDFLKYLTAVVESKKVEAERAHERVEQRSALMKDLLLTPFTLGLPLIRTLYTGFRRSRNS